MIRILRTAASAAVLAIVLATSFVAAPFTANAAEPFSAEQRAAVQALVRETLLSNPEIIMEAIDALQAKEAASREAQVSQVLVHMRPDLERDPASPVMGNPKGDVTIVEFFDYRCGYCKRVMKDLMAVAEADSNVRIVLQEFPILGPESVLASRASMAVWMNQPDKYEAYHTAMMTSRGNLTKDKVMQIALEVGIDVDAMQTDMGSKAIDAAFAKTAAMAQSLNITGTPAFIIGDRVVPGAVSQSDLELLVQEARK